MTQLTISEEAYQALVDAAAARNTSPDMIIQMSIQALEVQERQPSHPGHPLTEAEFEQALGMTSEESAEAEATARQMYPNIFAE